MELCVTNVYLSGKLVLLSSTEKEKSLSSRVIALRMARRFEYISTGRCYARVAPS